ncbi:histidinol-phosphate aminotransferase [Aureimonas endophytica]|uniref:Histidinol-phosphate aminotransferase n=1 Tax=Aureimonas endophytica TaxID=2027858 RepID=A0A916ZM49_9HYPH|nr:histidinol-phosphate transaminase [Aureimonas endophytica]GGE04179.1 histidinol-phosphate aminotransferase [Aureimonas endophytica]
MSLPSSPVRDEIRAIAPYNAGLTIEEVRRRYAVTEIAKLGSNENPLGPAPALRHLFSDIGELARLYPDPEGRALRVRLALDFAVSADRVVLGNGSEDLIAVLCRTILRPGDVMATLYPSFPLHEDYAVLMGGRVERVAVTADLDVDMEALIAAARRKPRLLMLSNPMNPVGAWLTSSRLAALLSAIDPETVLVVDEAYAEYADGADCPSAVALLEGSDLSWAVLRTFSKAYGLAGLRIGYGIVSDAALTGFLDRSRTPFNTNAIAQAAALVALEDRDHLRRSVELAVGERERLRAALAVLGFRIAPSLGNFLFFGGEEESGALAERLLAKGVIVKPWKQPGFERFLRVSIGAPRENDQFLGALKAVTGR